MRVGVGKPLIAAAAVASVITGVSLAQASTGNRESPSTNRSPSFGASVNPECATQEELNAYWEEHGEEDKAAVACNPDPDGDEAADAPNSSGNDQIDSWAEAQAVLDPENDPLVLIDHSKADGYFSIVLTVIGGADAGPPARVKTARQYARWMDRKAGDR